jgi:transposase-like protein
MATKRKTVPSGTNPQGDFTLIQIAQRFATEEAARDYFEKLRWPNGPVCAHCGNADQTRIYKVTANRAKKIRPGQYKCAECERSFTVTVGTVCEDSHIPLNKWLIGFYMMCASKTQVSALQLQRQLEIGSYRSALFMCQRIRFALMDVFPTEKLGGTVEADETYVGGKNGTVNHSLEEYGRYEAGQLVTTNTVEGFFGNAKRSLDGTHHNVSAKYLTLYLAELDYKYNTREETDGARTAIGIPKMVGKRLMLRRPAGKP